MGKSERVETPGRCLPSRRPTTGAHPRPTAGDRQTARPNKAASPQPQRHLCRWSAASADKSAAEARHIRRSLVGLAARLRTMLSACLARAHTAPQSQKQEGVRVSQTCFESPRRRRRRRQRHRNAREFRNCHAPSAIPIRRPHQPSRSRIPPLLEPTESKEAWLRNRRCGSTCPPSGTCWRRPCLPHSRLWRFLLLRAQQFVGAISIFLDAGERLRRNVRLAKVDVASGQMHCRARCLGEEPPHTGQEQVHFEEKSIVPDVRAGPCPSSATSSGDISWYTSFNLFPGITSVMCCNFL